jgi:hypothetical protein
MVFLLRKIAVGPVAIAAASSTAAAATRKARLLLGRGLGLTTSTALNPVQDVRHSVLQISSHRMHDVSPAIVHFDGLVHCSA